MKLFKSEIFPVLKCFSILSDTTQKVNNLLRIRVEDNKTTFSLSSLQGLFFYEKTLSEKEEDYSVVYPIHLFIDYFTPLDDKTGNLDIVKGKIEFNENSVHEFDKFKIEPLDERPYKNLISKEPLYIYNIKNVNEIEKADRFSGKDGYAGVGIYGDKIVSTDRLLGCVINSEMDSKEPIILSSTFLKVVKYLKCDKFTLKKFESPNNLSLFHTEISGINFLLSDLNYSVEDISKKEALYNHSSCVSLKKDTLTSALQRMSISSRINNNTKIIFKVEKDYVVLENKFTNKAIEKIKPLFADKKIIGKNVTLSCDFMKKLVSVLSGDEVRIYIAEDSEKKPIRMEDTSGNIKLIQATVR